MQEIVHRYLAVENGKHGRAARRRTALAPGVLADPVFVRQLDLALLDGVEDDLDRHQLHHAGRRRSSSAFFSNSTLPLIASIRIAVGVAVEAALFLLRAPCTLLLAAYTIPPQPTASADGRDQAAPRDDGRGV